MRHSTSIFDFWAGLPGNAQKHPDDEVVLNRVPHSFRFEGLPNPFFGPLKTARVVLLYLSPGYRCEDAELALSSEVHEYFLKQRTGTAHLPTGEEYRPTWRWWNKKVRQLGLTTNDVSQNIAFLNVCAYRSKKFEDWVMLSALPSSRVSVSWAQSILFPEAEAGRRVVICLRAASHWGLSKLGERYGHSLFSPRFTRAGIMLHGPIRDSVVHAVKAAIETS